MLHKPREPWPAGCANWQTDDPERFLWKFARSRSCACLMELADAEVDKFDDRFHRCFSQGRHDGHRCYYLAQRGEQTHPTIRDNCESLCLFSCTGRAAKPWAGEFNDPLLLAAATLDPQEHFFFLKFRGPAPARKLRLGPPAPTITAAGAPAESGPGCVCAVALRSRRKVARNVPAAWRSRWSNTGIGPRRGVRAGPGAPACVTKWSPRWPRG